MTAETRQEAPPLGAHVSSAGGAHRAPARAAALEATALQLFTKQPQRWAERTVGEEEASAFRAARAEVGVRVAAAHDSYLINLATADPVLFDRSVASFRAELARCVRLGMDFLVTHPGNATDGLRERAVRRNARAIGEALAWMGEVLEERGERLAARGEAPTWSEEAPILLLETTAGSGSVLGWRFDELAELLSRIPAPDDGLGVCLDTAHVHAAGYDLREDYEGALEAFDGAIGLGRLRLLHLNDSKAALGSRVDRHAHIGEGTLGEEPFARLLRDSRLRAVPRVIETPKGKDPEVEDRRNLATLRRLAGEG